MSAFLAIDPGASWGWTLIDAKTGTLLDLGGGHVPPPVGHAALRRAIIECPFVYPKRSGVDPNDLIKLGVQAGGFRESLASRGVRVDMVFPFEWKGQIDKLVHHPRILANVASAAEKKLVVARSKGLNKKALGDMLDALGLAQWAFASQRTL